MLKKLVIKVYEKCVKSKTPLASKMWNKLLNYLATKVVFTLNDIPNI